MTNEESQRIEERLQEEREQAQNGLRAVEEEGKAPPGEAAGDVSRFPTHLADESSNTEEEERDFMVATRLSDRLKRINEALSLLYADPERFERCQRCGAEIAFERFELIPWTRLCSACAKDE